MTWQTIALGELCDISGGMPGPRAGEFLDGAAGGIPVVSAADLVGHRVAAPPAKGLDPRFAHDLDRRFALRTGDILMTRSGTVGRVALVTEGEAGWLGGPHLIRIRASRRDVVDPGYLLAYLASAPTQDWIRRGAAGFSSVQHVSLRVLGELLVRLPPRAEQRRIGEALAALDDKIRAHEEVVRATAELRAVLVDRMTAEPGRAEP